MPSASAASANTGSAWAPLRKQEYSSAHMGVTDMASSSSQG